MKIKTVIGVDPGKEGFITVIKPDIILNFEIPKIKNEIDIHALSDLIMNICDGCDASSSIVVIEDVHALPRSAAKSTFNFGLICGILRMGFVICGMPLVLIAPKKWQKEMFEGIPSNTDKKVMSILAAKRLFPQQNLKRTSACKKDDDNLTDSLLIAEYGRRHFL